MVYSHEYGSLFWNWKKLGRTLAQLNTSRLEHVDEQLYAGPDKTYTAPALSLKFASATNLADDLVVSRTRDNYWNQIAQNIEHPEPVPAPPAGVFAAKSVREAVDGLKARSGRNASYEPEMAEKPLILLWRGHSADAPLQAIAELCGWKPTKLASGDYRLEYGSVQRPTKHSDFTTVFKSALPPDLVRYLTTKPATINGYPYVDITVNHFNNLPATFNPMEYVQTKVRGQGNSAKARLAVTVGNKSDFSSSYRDLSADHRRDVVLCLFTQAILDSGINLIAPVPNTHSYLSNPQESTMRMRADLMSITGPRGDWWGIRNGGIPRTSDSR